MTPEDRERRFQDALPFWTVCAYPSDFPHHYTLRVHWALKSDGVEIEPVACLYDTLAEARFECEAQGLVCIGRQDGDDDVIVEVWI